MRIQIATAIALCAAASPCFAGNLTFLSGTSFAQLDETDRALQLEAARQVLESDDRQAQQEWSNPRSGASGRVRSLGIFKSEDGLHCRKVRVSSTANGVESQFTFPVCRTTAGDWLIASGKNLDRV
jgi:surface antigen